MSEELNVTPEAEEPVAPVTTPEEVEPVTPETVVAEVVREAADESGAEYGEDNDTPTLDLSSMVRVVIAGGATRFVNYEAGLDVQNALRNAHLTWDFKSQMFVDGILVQQTSLVQPGSTIQVVGSVKGG